MKGDTLNEFVILARAFSESQRVKALHALNGGELCACQIIEYLGLAASTVSRHMAVLRQAGLIESRKKGRWVYYRINGKMSALAAAMSNHAMKSFGGSKTLRKTSALLEKIRCDHHGEKR